MKYLIICLVSIGCATTISGLLRLQDRELLIHPDLPGLAYPHKKEVCIEREKPFQWLGKKCKKEHTIDFYDFNKKEVRDALRKSGFRCKSPMRFKY